MSFASFPVEQLGLTAEQERQCARATASDILLVSKADLARKFGRNADAERTAQALIDATNKALMPRAKLASEMRPPDEVRIEGTPFACRVGAITEIAGESAAGKSHLTLSLALSAQLPALSTAPGGVLVLTSERPLSTSRLMEMGEAMLARHTDSRNPSLQQLLDNVETSAVADADSLEHALSFFLPPLLAARRGTEGSALLGEDVGPPRSQTSLQADEATSSSSHQDEARSRPADQAGAVDGVNGPHTARRAKPPVRLLILDSLAALLRAETALSGGGLVARSRRLCSLSDRLKALALEYHLAVVVVNQVSDVFTESLSREGPEMLYAAQARHFNGQSSGVRKEAALGIVWANCVNTRIMLARTGRRKVVTFDDLAGSSARKRKRAEAESTQEQEPAAGIELAPEPTLIRRMHQVFSAFGPPGSVDFVLAKSGVHVLPGSYRVLDLGPALRRRAARANVDPEASSSARDTPDTLDEPEGDEVGFVEEYGLGDLPEDFWEDELAVGVVD